MAGLPPDPQPYGSVAHPVSLDPTQWIVEVHWPVGGTIVVAEVPRRLAYLLSLDPMDPADGMIGDEVLTSGGLYDRDAVIPSGDYSTGKFDNTATLYAGSPSIDHISDTRRLTVGKDYAISGPGIPASARLTYTGAAAGTLSAAATMDAANSPVVISINIWEFRVIGNFPAPITLEQSQYRKLEDAGDGSRFSGFVTLFTPDVFDPRPDAQTQEYNALIAAGYPPSALLPIRVDDGGTDLIYRGVNFHPFTTIGLAPPQLPPVGQIFQQTIVEAEFSDIFLINMGLTKLVQINQLPYNEPYHRDQTGNFIPGYLAAGGGTKLRAYPPGTQFSLTSETVLPGQFGEAVSLVINATDPNTAMPADPLWTATVPPTAHPPASPVEIARFDKDGLV